MCGCILYHTPMPWHAFKFLPCLTNHAYVQKHFHMHQKTATINLILISIYARALVFSHCVTATCNGFFVLFCYHIAIIFMLYALVHFSYMYVCMNVHCVRGAAGRHCNHTVNYHHDCCAMCLLLSPEQEFQVVSFSFLYFQCFIFFGDKHRETHRVE